MSLGDERVTPPTIPVIRVGGTHREVGLQLGVAGREQIVGTIEQSFSDLPSGRTVEEQLALAARYREFAQPRLPWLIEELEGCAEGARVDPLSFFATSLEEIWYSPYPKRTDGRCSDLVAGPSATANGHLLVAHNNDLRPEVEAEIVAIEKAVTGDPVIFQIGLCPWVSVGWNSAGISLTGNELSPNDERLGVSRSHQVFEILRARSLDEALASALRPDRASSYNNVLTSADGGVANVEGSRTDAEVTGLDEQDHLAHTNHYVCDRMLQFEGDVDYAKRSAIRFDRARELLAAQPRGSIGETSLREMLSDHETKPDSLCRHPEFGYENEKTVFWCVADVTDGRITFGRGNPCESQAQSYAFTGYGEHGR
jgi:isopenicillin-N N-acyltransferase-like protein